MSRPGALPRGAVIAGLGVAVCLAGPTTAEELHVPGRFGTIQAAVDAARDGDEVIVAAGEYTEATDLRGKRITLRSSGGAAATILDGASLTRSILVADSGESRATVVQGFTFRHGRGTFADACRVRGNHGGAIFVRDGGITVLDSVFVGTTTQVPEGNAPISAGGAISACEADLVVARSRFEGNGANFGGAIRFAASVSRQASIAGSAFVGNYSGHGGAILGELDGRASIEVTHCAFLENQASHGGSLRVVAAEESRASVRDSSFADGAGAFGGAANLTADPGDIEVVRCDFVDNEAGFGGALFLTAWGGPQGSAGGRIRVTAARIVGNVAHPCCDAGLYQDGCFRDDPAPNGPELLYGGGAGAHASSCAGGVVELVNCTLVDNEPYGIHFRLGTSDHPDEPGLGAFQVANSIVRGGTGPEEILVEIPAPGPTVAVTHSNVEHGAAGAGNIDAPVAFRGAAAGDYRLAPGAAGIDAGDNGAIDPTIDVDLDGGSRFVDDPVTGDTGAGAAPVVDIGADEYRPSLRRPRRVVRDRVGPTP